jgi:hypothetical protein
MKNLLLNAENVEVFRRTNKLLITACMLLCLATGWYFGSITTHAFSQSDTITNGANGIILNSIPIKGEALPTIMLREFSVIAEQRGK